MKRFCVECGKEIAKGTHCKECRGVEFSYSDISLHACIKCGRMLFRNKWFLPSSLEEGMAKAVSESMRKRTEVLEFETNPDDAKPGKEIVVQVPVIVEGAEAEIPAKILFTTCPACSKQGTQYFEAILRIRPFRKEVVSFVLNDIEKQKSKGVFLNKKEDEDDGINLYLTNQTYAKVIARKLKEQFGAVVSLDEKLFSHNKQTSRDVFRLSVHIQLPRFSKDDAIFFNGNHFQVNSVKGKLSVTNLETGGKTSLPFKEDYKKAYLQLPSSKAQVYTVKPMLEVAEPESGQAVTVANAEILLKHVQAEIKPGDEIKVAFHDGSAWALLE